MTKELASIIEIFHEAARNMQDGKCATCGGEIGPWTDELSKREYYVSGMCQHCQDSVFTEDLEDESEYEPPEDDEQPTDLQEHEDFARDNLAEPDEGAF